MYAKYPVLLRFVTQTTVHYIDFVKEMLDRVSMDRDELASFAGVGDDFRLEDMSIDRGDAHDGGRAVAMLTIGAADGFGLPVSTTQVLSSGVAGTMAANGSGLQWPTIRNMLLAWVLTLPAAIGLAAGLYWLFTRLL